MDPKDLRLVITEDGSHTLYVPSIEETYHSKFGAIQESMHVFIKHGLEYFIDQTDIKKIRILEVGFGTGLNVLLTEREMRKFPEIQVFYLAIEPNPLPTKIINQLNYCMLLKEDKDLWEKIHSEKWDSEIAINKNFFLLKQRVSLEDIFKISKINIVYFDAFAPGKQPDVWKYKELSKIYDGLEENGLLVTFCAQGEFKRNLVKLGFRIEVLPGPPGKHQMIRAAKIA